MSLLIRYLLLTLAFATPLVVHADTSMLYVVCEGGDVGAEVLVNGKFKGECPVDIQMVPGTLKLLVVKRVDASRERIFEKEIRMGDSEVKKIEAVLSARLYAAAQKSEDQGLAVEQAEAAKREADEARKRAEFDAELASGTLQAGRTFRDCADCPEMVFIPAGSLEMGSNDFDVEKPVHRVTLSSVFALGKTEVTQGQWKSIMGNNLSLFSKCGDNCPVENVSWNDAQEFIQKLNAKTGKQYRLPTEAEWEYACRAGGQQKYCGSDNLDSVGWYTKNSGSKTHSVAQKQANAFGLYDMSGNVWEYVKDSWHDNYNGAPTDGSAWSGDGAKRVLRSGSWNDTPQDARAANRYWLRPADRYGSSGGDFGFRLARMLP